MILPRKKPGTSLLHTDLLLDFGKGRFADTNDIHDLFLGNKRAVFLPVGDNCGRLDFTDTGQLLQLIRIRGIDID